MATSSNRQKSSLAAQAYRVIYEKIITMDFEPGRYLDEKQLVTQLGIGRTPIREALVRLTSESLVQNQPNKGFIVSPLTVQNIKAMFEALRIMEMGVASLAVHQDPTGHLPLMEEAHHAVKMAIGANDLLGLVWSNNNFHMHFAHCSANDYLVRSLKNVRNEANRLAYLSFGGIIGLDDELQGHYQSVIREHEKIVDYLKDKDLEWLKETIEAHIRTFQQRVILYLTTSLA